MRQRYPHIPVVAEDRRQINVVCGAAREKSYAVLECGKPVISAVNGPCLGAGLGLASMADILVASENALFGLPEIDVGLAGGARRSAWGQCGNRTTG